MSVKIETFPKVFGGIFFSRLFFVVVILGEFLTGMKLLIRGY